MLNKNQLWFKIYKIAKIIQSKRTYFSGIVLKNVEANNNLKPRDVLKAIAKAQRFFWIGDFKNTTGDHNNYEHSFFIGCDKLITVATRFKGGSGAIV